VLRSPSIEAWSAVKNPITCSCHVTLMTDGTHAEQQAPFSRRIFSRDASCELSSSAEARAAAAVALARSYGVAAPPPPDARALSVLPLLSLGAASAVAAPRAAAVLAPRSSSPSNDSCMVRGIDQR
jgi:hypothetical protein